MKSTFVILFLFIIAFNIEVKGQNYFSTSYDILGESEVAWQMLEFNEFYYIIAPSYCSVATTCTSLIKVDSQFNVLWDKTYDGIIPGSLTSLVKSDTALYLFGVLNSPTDTSGLSVLMLNENGEILNQWYYGTSNPDVPKGISINNSDGFNIVISENIGTNRNKLWIYYCDLFGTMLYRKQYGNEYMHTNVYSVIKSVDEKTLVLGCSGCNFPNCETIERFILIIDSAGNIINKILLDTIEFGNSPYTYACPDLDKSIYAINHIYSPSKGIELPIIRKYNLEGSEKWSYIFDSDEYLFLNRIMISEDNNIIGIGKNENHPFIDTSFEKTRFNGGWIFSISDEGFLNWNRIIGDLRYPGPGFGELLDVYEVPSGNLFAVGSIDDFIAGSDPQKITSDVWLLYLDEVGCLNPNCNSGFNPITKIEDHTFNKSKSVFKVFPNPVANVLNIEMLNDQLVGDKLDIQVVNILGQIQCETSFIAESTLNSISIGFLDSGIYYLIVNSLEVHFISLLIVE